MNDTLRLATTFNLPPDARRLLVVLHGYEDDPGSLIELLSSFTARHQWAVVAPVGPTRAPHGPAWFPSLEGDQGPGLGPTLDAIEHSVTALVVDHGLVAADTVVLGWSQGAAVALALGLRAGGAGPPRTIVALSPWLVNEPDVDWDFAAAVARGTRLFLVHGVDDEIVPVTQARSAQRVLDRTGIDVTLVEVDAGHDLRALVRPALAWLGAELG